MPRLVRGLAVCATGAVVAAVIASMAGGPLRNQSQTRVKSLAPAGNGAVEGRPRGASMPLYFERNDGQTDRSVRFLSHGARSSLFLTDDAAVIALVGGRIDNSVSAAAGSATRPARLIESAVSIRLLGANRKAPMTGVDPLRARVNYLIGENPANWHTGVPTFSRVKIAGIYPGVDLAYYGSGTSLEYDLTVAPGADPSQIRFTIDGQRRSVLDSAGNLRLVTDAGVITLRKPVAYQLAADGSRTSIAGSFAVASARGLHEEVAFRLGSYDHSRELTIDPAIDEIPYSTYLGGDASSVGPVTLEQFSALTDNTPLTVADVGTHVAVDTSDNVYVTGIAYSNDFPLQSAEQGTLAGANSPPKQNPNGFISKLDTSQSGPASLVYSTYFGGSGDTAAADKGDGNGDLPFGITVDSDGQVYVVGQTYSTNFPGVSLCGSFGKTFDGAHSFVNNGFVSKLNASGSAIVYSCYVNGQDNATEARVALFPAGCGGTSCKAYVAGSTQSDTSTGFPVTGGAFQTALAATNGKSNATFVVVHEDGQSLDYATLYGGAGNGTNADTGLGVAVDSNGNGYITGGTFSSNLTVPNGAFTSYMGGTNQTSNPFVAEFNPSASGGSSLVYATYLGGSGAVGTIGSPVNFSLALGDVGTGIAIDSNNNIWVTGFTASTDFRDIPGTVATVFQDTNVAATLDGTGSNPPATNAFVTEISANHALSGGNQILYSTYFGGTGVEFSVDGVSGSVGFGDVATDLAIVNGQIYLTGATASGDLISGIQGFFPLSTNACFVTNRSSGVPIIKSPAVDLPVTAWAAELDPTQSVAANQEVFATLLGGSGIADAGSGVGVLSNGDLVVAGLTYSSDFPATSNGFQVTNAAAPLHESNAFVTVLNPAGNTCPTPFATPTAAATAVIGAAPATIKFGDVDATGTSTAHKLTITNKSAVTASIGQITVRGPFAISGPDACSEASLLPKKPCSVELVFTPPVPTALATGSVSIQYNGLSPAVALEGTGIAVVLTAPKSESFPATAAGSSSAAKTIDISNPSAVAVTMGTAVIAGAYGSSGTDSCSGQTLAAKKGKCEVGVKFEPAAMTAPKTAEAGSLTIPFTYGANDGQVVVKLNGVVK